MANLRLIAATVIDSTHINAKFSENLNEDIDVGNVSFSSQTPNIPTPSVLQVDVVLDTLQITCQPLTPQAAYFIIFQSIPGTLFNSLNGDAALLNDGITNQQLILGPIEADNPIKTYLTNFLRGNVYDLEPPSNVSKYIEGLALVLAKSLHDVRQAKNDNYLSITITDEVKTRSEGPFDRLNEEGAYEIIRVGKNKTNAPLSLTTAFALFPDFLVSLLAATNTENVTVSSSGKVGTFDLNSFTLTLSKSPIIILNNITFVYGSALPPFQYDTSIFGYQLLESKYDPEHAFTFLQLANNQIRLNDVVLSDPNFSTENIIQIVVSYQYKDLGRVIDPNTVRVDAVLPSGREVLPAIENIATLQHAPIVKANDTAGSVGDVSFIDPNQPQGSGFPHPAFVFEIPFRLEQLPNKPGIYSIDYPNGNVYVFGADANQDGTGAFPPYASYLYRHIFTSEVDYVYDPDTSDLVALPNGNLTNSVANVSFNYENVLVANVDYQAEVHIEALNERITNRLTALNALSTLHSPITNVFRIFNETTGEIYPIIRFTDNQVFFNFSKAPNIQSQKMERASFQDILNETLFVSSSSSISVNQNIFQFFLSNNQIIAATEDEIGSSFNSSIKFSNNAVFVREIYFDNQLSINQNNARLQTIGDYQIDYLNGVVWCLVSSGQDFSVGSVSYKRGYINPDHPHLITVDDIYYRFSPLDSKIRSFNYRTFTDGSILPSSFDVANEGFLLGNLSQPYQVLASRIGTFINASFVPGISSSIKFVRGLFEYQDLLHNPQPINFFSTATFNSTQLTANPITFAEYQTVQFDGTHFFIAANTNLLYLSPNITITVSAIRLSDNANLWNSSGTIKTGSPFQLVLPGVNSPAVGDSVLLTYSYNINDLSRIIVDYNRGDYFVDYSYLADEILVSYEYGDNVIDFRQSLALNAGESYFVSYKAGALRDSLLKNFGTLIDIPLLNNLDTSFARERYRDALMAAMQSFTAGPTTTSIRQIVHNIAHTPADVIESAFQNWTLGNSLLNPAPIKTTGTLQLVPAKYDNGVVVDSPGQSITFPACFNLRLEQGSFETWVVPQWNGLDNAADLTVRINRNGIPLPTNKIFVGPAGNHPTLTNNAFTISANDRFLGVPNEHKDGVFLYYAPDITNQFNRWFLDVFDGYDSGDGYGSNNYTITLTTDGRFYDVKSNVVPAPASDSITSGTNSITWRIDGYTIVKSSLTFLADHRHYLFDFAQEEQRSRFSLYKDESGYMNFSVIDQAGNPYLVSADVSSWKEGQQHHVAAAWALNSKVGRDELHLFLDGLEVPNIFKYRDRISPYLHEKFRTVNPEEVVDVIPLTIIASTDLTTSAGSAIVSSSINFSAAGITGGVLFIEEPGFDPNGYTILSVAGNSLILTTTMPLTITGGFYSINKTTFPVKTEIDLYPNVAISLLHSTVAGIDLQTTAGSNVVSSPSSNFSLIGVQPGFLIRIPEPGFAPHYIVVAVSGNQLTLHDPVPTSFSATNFFIYPNTEVEIPGVRALHPAYQISRDINGQTFLTIRDKAAAHDIILIRTLGVNNRRIDRKYFVWGNTSNIIMTQLSAPIVLNDVQITHIPLDSTLIGPNNSTLAAGIFTSNNIPTDQPSVSDSGRTLAVNITGSNIDYSVPVSVNINGSSSETLTFTANGTQNTIHRYTSINFIKVVCKPIDSSKNCLVVSIKEAFPITVAENSSTVPVIRLSYQVLVGNNLSGAGNTVSDPDRFFSETLVGNYLVIQSPNTVAGQYQILAVSNDHHSMTISGNLATFNAGIYEALNVSTYRSGLQNGFFTFELAADGYRGDPYALVQGQYEFQYYTYLSIPLDLTTSIAHVGTDFHGDNTFNGTIDELQILSNKLSDTRIGEVVNVSTGSITKDFHSLKALKPSSSSLMLLHFDQLPFTNAASVYLTTTKRFVQSSISVNDNFDRSIAITDTPFIIDNTGIFNSKKEGTVEFWVNPFFDTENDNNFRYYFDATSLVNQQVISSNNLTVKITGRAANVISVKLPIDRTGIDYFAGGKIGADGQTILLNRPLPAQQVPVIVSYIPTGTQGDRFSIYKDPLGFVNLDVFASGTQYQIRAPAFWIRNTWHRIKAIYRFNSGAGSDELRLFVDGYERGNLNFGDMLWGQNQTFGTSFIGPGNIQSSIVFKDTINELYLGSEFTGKSGAQALFNNYRISNLARPTYLLFGESIDVSFSSNLNVVLPVPEDLYTTLLLDFTPLLKKTNDFTTLKNRKTGLFDFTVNVFDGFDILAENNKSKLVLETLIDTLKPANSRAFVKFQ